MIQPLTRQQTIAQLKGSYMLFLRHFFKLKTGREFTLSSPPGRESHFFTVAKELKAVFNGETQRLLINIPPGHAKPLHEETLVLRDDGSRVLLKEINIGDKILTHAGRFKEVKQIFKQGLLPCIKINTFSGVSLISALDHSILTAKGWKQAADLEVDDVLGMAVPRNNFGKPVAAEEARLLGYFIGDGSVSGNNCNITSADPQCIEDIMHCCDVLGFTSKPIQYNLKNRKAHMSQTLVRINIRSGINAPRDWLKQHGIADKNSYTKRIPKCIMLGDFEAIKQFMGAYFACDGTFGHKGQGRRDFTASITSVSRDMMEDCRHLFVRLGVRTRIRTKISNIKTKAQGDKYTSYILEFTSQDDVYNFQKLLGDKIHHSKANIMRAHDFKRQRFDSDILADPIISIEEYGQANCMCLEVEEDHTFTANDLIVHNSTMLVYWVAWCYANYPDCNFLYISHAYELAEKHTATIKEVMELPAYREMFNVELRTDSKAKGKFKTTAGGTCAAFGSQGAVVGQDAGLPNCNRFSGGVIIDDAHKPDDCHSDTLRQKPIDNFNETIKQRPRSGTVPIIFIGQRLHESDLPAFLASGADGYDWKKVILKSLDEHDNPLHPDVFPKSMLEIERKVNPYAFFAQHQQTPQPDGGGIFQKDWFRLTDMEPTIVSSFITIDTAETDKNWNDATAMSFWGLYRIEHRGIDFGTYGLHWLGCREVRIEPKDLEAEFYDFYAECMRHKVKPDRILIEKKSSGTTLLSLLKGVPGLRTIAIERNAGGGNKTARFYECQKYVASNMISLTEGARHAEMCITHMGKITSNDSHAFDDIADTLEMSIRAAMIDKTLLPYDDTKSDIVIEALNQRLNTISHLRRQI